MGKFLLGKRGFCIKFCYTFEENNDIGVVKFINVLFDV